MKDVSPGLLPVELMVDHPELDRQHDEIFSRIDAIKTSALASGVPPQDALAELVTYFVGHFATEERLARAAAIDFSAHALEHARALRVLNKGCRDLAGGRLDLRTFLRYLEYWFEQHINEFDKSLGDRLQPRSGSNRSHAAGAMRTAGLST